MPEDITGIRIEVETLICRLLEAGETPEEVQDHATNCIENWCMDAGVPFNYEPQVKY